MKTIWKFPIDAMGHHRILMPIGEKILHVDDQRGFPCLWAEVDTEAGTEGRVIRVVGTGHPLPDALFSGSRRPWRR